MDKSALVIIIFILNLNSGNAQALKWTKEKVNSFLVDTLPAEQPRFLAYPTIAYSPETRWEFGISSLYLYYAKRDTLNRLSELTGFTFITQERQYGFWLDHALYSDQNKWFYLGRFRWQSFPLLYYGIGPFTTEDPLAVVDANYLLFRERVLRRLYKSFYVGIEVDVQRLSNVSFNWEETSGELPLGSQGSTNLGLGLGIVHDDRHNVLNVRKGWFAELAYLRYGIGNNALSFSNLLIENRWYIPTKESEVLAIQLLGQFVGGDVPFNQMALMGGESLMRGYYLGRYRDRAMVAGQVEYRWLPFPFSQRWGAAAFMALGQVAPEVSELQLSRLLPAGGVGVRFLLFKKKDIYTRVDVAFTEEGPGFYFFIGEAF
ncbi:BamA/TamA family outer membrane protein [Catalinimonas niigatensis]|uniref:BamA/TamA family outer membrane protein n=1 Tax=Catalinimonas niigatensis TaxID=1397264 RepID=UPI0026655B08|nr:BamA/TamA family outer membrane protein [Catalinimonas niigatensis]WPP50994.1 BamA/TamA family outer membrane protein [Catalinimonas niigatensis]